MHDRDYAERARRIFFAPRELERDERFRNTLTRHAETGLQWGGVVGMTGVFILILVHWGLLGRPASWWYPVPVTETVFVLWDKAVVLLACIGAITVGRAGCRLQIGRLVGGGLAVAVAAVSLTHDAYRGILSVEYLVLVYLLIVAVIPYRPWQTLVLGGVLTTVFYAIGQYGLPGTAAADPQLARPGHLVRMGFGTVVLTGVSALLLSTRYQQHRARRNAERLHEQVATLERAKSAFFADISHEFRTPLTLLLGSLREALDGRLGELSAPLRDRITLMEDQVQRMKRLVNQLLDLATVDSGQLHLAVQKCDLVGVTRRLLPPFRQWAKDDGLSFQTDIPADRIDVWVDPDRIEDVLTTLLSNAIKYTGEDGAVRVRLRQVEGVAEIAVRDTGPGLPADLEARVFGSADSAIPVRDGDEAATRSPTAHRWIGMGIGLAHARALVERHNGTLDVESESGFGTEFTVRLPLGRGHLTADEIIEEEEGETPDRTVHVDPSREPTALPVDDPDPEGPDDAPRVFVVDDEAEMRGYIRSLLGSSYRVETANDGEEALARLREDPPDLVLSDAVMPGRDGISLCRAIRDDDQLRHLPVILLSARPGDDARLSGMQAGADAYVSKPFDPAALEARVENLIEIRRLVQDRVRVPEWLEPKEGAISSEETDFLEEVNAVVTEHIDNSNFGVDWLADEMDLSTRHLRRRLKEVTRLSPAGFIRTRRLKHAAALIREGADTVSDVASAVGYRDPSYFSRLFRETFGCSPTEYAEQDRDRPEEPDVAP